MPRLTVALGSSPPKPRVCCLGLGVRWREWGLGPSVPQRAGCPFPRALKPPPPRALGPCQKNTPFILSFIFLIKGLHIIIFLTKTKVFVSEFEKHFPRINGKGSLINIFKKTKAKLVPKASFFPVSFVASLLGARAGIHAHPYPCSPSAVFLGASFIDPQSPPAGSLAAPGLCYQHTAEPACPVPPQRLCTAEDRAYAILRGTWALGVLRGLHLGPSILDEETEVQRGAGT